MTSRTDESATRAGGRDAIPELRFVPRDRFEHARDLVERLSAAGLRAFSSWECAPSTVSVTACSLGLGAGRAETVWCLPWPGREALYWHRPRVTHGDDALLGRWFEPLCPLGATACAAAHLLAAVRGDRGVSIGDGRAPQRHS